MPSSPPPLLSLERLRWTHGALAGVVLGAASGAWTASSQAPPPPFSVATARPPLEHVVCPEGYAPASDVGPSTRVAGSPGVRYLARCDPRASSTAYSESLEAYWTNTVEPDPRGLVRSLREFVRAVTAEGALVLDPIPEPGVARAGGAPAFALDTGGAYRLPPMTVRTWVLPAGGNTLEVTLSSPRARADAALASAQGALDHVGGLRAYDPTLPGVAGWHVTAACPAGFEDATPPAGGGNPGIYVGRYCLAPDEQGGVELTFAELPARADTPDAVRRLLDLAATTMRAVGLPESSAFGPSAPAHVAGVDGATAVMQLEPPASRVRVRALVAPAGDATLYGLAVADPAHAEASARALEAWLGGPCRARMYDGALLSEWKTARALRTVLAPAILTALLGAAIAYVAGRRARAAAITVP